MNAHTARTMAVLVVLGMLCFSSNSYSQVVAGPIVNPANGHEYLLLAQSSWTAAEAAALALGGHLVTVNDSAENDWISSTFEPLKQTADAPMWIGFTDAAVEGSFVWTSGEPVTFTAWAPGEPNDGHGAGEDFAFIYPNVALNTPTWNDSNDGDNPYHGLVERSAPPGTVTIDIKPGSSQNTINLAASGVIPVAILSTATFDATSAVNPDTLFLAGARVRVVGRGNKLQCNTHDVNGDNRADLVCHFENELNAQPGDSVAVLEGQTYAGTTFTGSDTIRIVP